MRRAILIIYTGGTIGMSADATTGALCPIDFATIYDEFPPLRTLNVDIDVKSLMPPIDSANMTLASWVRLAELIKENYARYDGFVVLHGTDTMSYTASAMSFMLENLAKPIIFTGSQIPVGVLRTDGKEHLITAVEIAAAQRNGVPEVREVALYFQNRLLRANRTTKRNAEALNAFRSYNYPPLAEVGVNIIYYKQLMLEAKGGDEELQISTKLDENVLIVKLTPALNEAMLSAMLAVEGLRGVVLETYGAGNAPSAEWFIGALTKAIDRGVVVLNVTQCGGGKVSMHLYETGQALQRAGVVSGRDMTSEAAVAKLCYLLGQNLSHEEIINALNTSLRGEFSE